MVQQSLCKWLNLKDDFYKIKEILYLDWTNLTPKNTIWLNKIPDQFNNFDSFKYDKLMVHVYWKPINKNITICGVIKKRKIFTDEEEKYSNFSFLKSHLQKSIRRGNDNNAVKTAYHMIKINPNQFLRRVLIIMLEDVVLHECFGIILWLTVATSNYYSLSIIQVEWLLGVIRVLCLNSYKDIYNLESCKETRLYDMLNNRYLDLSESQYSILYSMHLRESYGGMKCDKKMINNFCKLWYNRFKNNIECDKLDTTLIRPISIKLDDLELCHWELSAIDFHCAKYLVDIIIKKYPEYSIDYIKKLIWNCSSKINFREEATNIENKDWNKIKYFVFNKQKYILYKYSLFDEYN